MATGAEYEGSLRSSCQSCDETQGQALKMDNFESAVSFALQHLDSHDIILKPEQKEAVKMVWEGNDVFVLLPTGFGKSIIYEVLPFIFDYKLDRVDGAIRSLVIVVISLMADQVASLRRRGTRAAMISSKCATLDKSLLATEKDLYTSSFLFGSPEALITSKWRDAMDCRDVAQRIIAVVIDEAHCVSKWYVHTYTCIILCMYIHNN